MMQWVLQLREGILWRCWSLWKAMDWLRIGWVHWKEEDFRAENQHEEKCGCRNEPGLLGGIAWLEWEYSNGSSMKDLTWDNLGQILGCVDYSTGLDLEMYLSGGLNLVICCFVFTNYSSWISRFLWRCYWEEGCVWLSRIQAPHPVKVQPFEI